MMAAGSIASPILRRKVPAESRSRRRGGASIEIAFRHDQTLAVLVAGGTGKPLELRRSSLAGQIVMSGQNVGKMVVTTED
jgi:hypothetical protein